MHVIISSLYFSLRNYDTYWKITFYYCCIGFKGFLLNWKLATRAVFGFPKEKTLPFSSISLGSQCPCKTWKCGRFFCVSSSNALIIKCWFGLFAFKLFSILWENILEEWLLIFPRSVQIIGEVMGTNGVDRTMGKELVQESEDTLSLIHYSLLELYITWWSKTQALKSDSSGLKSLLLVVDKMLFQANSRGDYGTYFIVLLWRLCDLIFIEGSVLCLLYSKCSENASLLPYWFI